MTAKLVELRIAADLPNPIEYYSYVFIVFYYSVPGMKLRSTSEFYVGCARFLRSIHDAFYDRGHVLR